MQSLSFVYSWIYPCMAFRSCFSNAVKTLWPEHLIEERFSWGIKVSEFTTIIVGNMAAGREEWHWNSSWEFSLSPQIAGRDLTRCATGFLNFKALLGVIYSQQDHTIFWSFPNSCTDWGPSIQIYETIGNYHSSCLTDSDFSQACYDNRSQFTLIR